MAKPIFSASSPKGEAGFLRADQGASAEIEVADEDIYYFRLGDKVLIDRPAPVPTPSTPKGKKKVDKQ